jgi:methanogenesis imperfect marker protein 11
LAETVHNFCDGFYTLIDDKTKMALIIEKCKVKGTVEWDAVNRLRAGGVVKRAYTEGTTLLMRTSLGSKRPNFGPVGAGKGAQALKSVIVREDKVYTRWLGLAGASIGAGACLPCAPGVISSRFIRHTGIGGSKYVEVELVTPKLRRMVIGLDDTDNRFEGATWVLALKLARKMPYGKFLDLKIVQLAPFVAHRTTNCCATAVSFAISDRDFAAGIRYTVQFLSEKTFSDNTAIAVYEGIEIPKSIVRFGQSAKRSIRTISEALRLAKQNGITIEEITGTRGVIGALAAIGCFDMGPEAASVTIRNV